VSQYLSAGVVAGVGGVTGHDVRCVVCKVESLTVVTDEPRTTVTRVACGEVAFMTDAAVLART